MPPRHLLFAFAVSLALHVTVLGAGALKALVKPTPPRALQVELRLPPADIPLAEALVKNTLDPEAPKPLAKPREPKIEKRPQPATRPLPAKTEKRQVQAAQQKIARHTYYPEEARLRGLEGTVHVLVVLTDDGSISDVQLAASSGHTILDNGAIKDTWAIGRFPGITLRQMILTVTFRLE